MEAALMEMANLSVTTLSLMERAQPCFEEIDNPPPVPNASLCPNTLSECFARENSACSGERYSSRYDNASAAWVVYCAILMFFMKAGFLYLEESFSKDDKVFRRRVVLAKYIDIFAGTFGFWLFGYAISSNTDGPLLGEEQDYIFWFFRFTFATNTATILGGTLVGQGVQLRTTAIFVYSFVMTAFIHPVLARFFWSVDNSDERPGIIWSPYATCNGTFTARRSHEFTEQSSDFGRIVFIDFAGSGLVHLCGGMGALALAIFHKFETSKKLKIIRECGNCCNLLKRDQNSAIGTTARVEEQETVAKPKGFIEWMYPSGGGEENVESAALGIIILWTTWFAFNAGSTESISGKKVHAAVGRIALTMCLACASAGIVQTIVSGLVQIYKRDTTFNSNEIANVVLGALVAVTGCCPFITPTFSLLIGEMVAHVLAVATQFLESGLWISFQNTALTVAVYHLGCLLEYLLRIHDGARVFPVHGMCGFYGVLCVGVFSRTCLIRELYEDLCFCVTSELPSMVDNRGLLFLSQLAGGLFIAVWSFVFCSLMFLGLWFIPVKFLLACLPKVFSFSDERRGRIQFSGNVLFTHFNEIGDPAPTDVDNDNSYMQPMENVAKEYSVNSPT